MLDFLHSKQINRFKKQAQKLHQQLRVFVEEDLNEYF